MIVRLLLLLGLSIPHLVPAAPPAPDAGRPREMLAAALRYADARWDEKVGLLWSPAPGEEGRIHRTRESTWYALGLLMRAAPGDEARAARILAQVAARQFAAPGQPWDGTFQRSPEEPPPPPEAKLWRDFDPNWRQFIGSTFVLVLAEFEPRLPADLPAKLREAIRRAVEGELTEGRAEPYHTNILLMQTFLLGHAGAELRRPDWVARAERQAEEIAAAFARHETFEEYNSPTYYGVDFYGLALWRRHGATEKIRALGAKMEAGLWRDVGRFYHAGLKNLCGPFDRAYGMDMRRYVSLTGIWMGLALPAEQTPLPDPAGPMDHAHDFLVTPAYVLLGAQIPADVLGGFGRFGGERELTRAITPERTATAWLARDVMIGGEITGGTRGANAASGQFHPATIHWRIGENDVGWVRLAASPNCDARAGRSALEVATLQPGKFVFRVSAPGLKAAMITRERWSLPGLSLAVETDSEAFSVEAGEEYLDVHYGQALRIAFRVLTVGGE